MRDFVSRDNRSCSMLNFRKVASGHQDSIGHVILVPKIKVPITPRIFLGRNKSLYRTEQDSAIFFFLIWLKPRFFFNFQSYVFFPARPSDWG